MSVPPPRARRGRASAAGTQGQVPLSPPEATGAVGHRGPAPVLLAAPLRWQHPAASGRFPRRGVYPRNVFFPWAAHRSAQGLLCALSWAAPKPTAAGRGSGAGLALARYGCALKSAALQPVGASAEVRGPRGRVGGRRGEPGQTRRPWDVGGPTGPKCCGGRRGSRTGARCPVGGDGEGWVIWE